MQKLYCYRPWIYFFSCQLFRAVRESRRVQFRGLSYPFIYCFVYCLVLLNARNEGWTRSCLTCHYKKRKKIEIILKEKKKGEGGQQREQKLLQQRKRVASPRVWVFPVGLVYYLFVVCVVLSCIENNNASRGQTILGYSPGLLYSKCPCLVLLPISCRPRSTTADMTSSTQLSVRFFSPTPR